jgi:hypothetical protein
MSGRLAVVTGTPDKQVDGDLAARISRALAYPGMALAPPLRWVSAVGGARRQ